MAHSKETPKIYFHVYRAKSSPHNQNWYAHRSIVSYGKCSFLNVFLILWKIEVESPIFFHDKYDLNYASSHLNIYKATFLFDSWALWPPEIWHCIFMTNQVSQYVLWVHICVGGLGDLWRRKWLISYWTPSFYVNQWWMLVIQIGVNSVKYFIQKIDCHNVEISRHGYS